MSIQPSSIILGALLSESRFLPAVAVTTDRLNSPSFFNRCEPIAKFYQEKKVPVDETFGAFGGRSQAWVLRDAKDRTYEVYCRCDLFTLGFGHLVINSSNIKDSKIDRLFTGSSRVDQLSGDIKIQGIVPGIFHKITLPMPKN